MKSFNLFAIIALLCISGNTYAMSVKAAFLCSILATVGSGIGTTMVIKPAAIENVPEDPELSATTLPEYKYPNRVYFPKKQKLLECLEQNEELRPRDDVYQRTIEASAAFFAGRWFKRTAVYPATRNLILTELLRQDFLPNPTSTTHRALNSTYYEALTRTPALAAAAFKCETTPQKHHQEKKGDENQKNWIRD